MFGNSILAKDLLTQYFFASSDMPLLNLSTLILNRTV